MSRFLYSPFFFNHLASDSNCTYDLGTATNGDLAQTFLLLQNPTQFIPNQTIYFLCFYSNQTIYFESADISIALFSGTIEQHYIGDTFVKKNNETKYLIFHNFKSFGVWLMFNRYFICNILNFCFDRILIRMNLKDMSSYLRIHLFKYKPFLNTATQVKAKNQFFFLKRTS